MANAIATQYKNSLLTYKLLKGNATLTKSLVLRLILGVLGGLPTTSLALFTALERIGFSVFDVVVSRADRTQSQLVKIGIIGLFLKIIADVVLISLFFIAPKTTVMLPVFLSVSGLLLGAGQALTQGHIEDFYLLSAKKYFSYLVKNSHIEHEQKTLSYWSWWAAINMASIFILLGSTYFLYYFYRVEVLLFFTLLQNFFLLVKVIFDQKKYLVSAHAADQNITLKSDTTEKARVFNVENVFLTIINSFSMLLLLSSCYFMFISICLDDSVKSQFNLWLVIVLFVLGYEYLGAFLSQYLAPQLTKYYKQNMLFAAIGVCITSLIFMRFHSRNLDFFTFAVNL
jgi:hypothetical protein